MKCSNITSDCSIPSKCDASSLVETRIEPTTKNKGGVEKVQRIERGLYSWVLSGIKRKIGLPPKTKGNDDQDRLESSPDQVVLVSIPEKRKVKVAPRARKPPSKLIRLQDEQDQAKARLRGKCIDQEKEEAEETVRQRTLGPLSGEFGEGADYEDGNYIYRQNKRTYNAKVQLAKQNEPEPEYDDTTDVEVELAQLRKRTSLGLALKDEQAKGSELLDESAARASAKSFEASKEYQEWLHNN